MRTWLHVQVRGRPWCWVVENATTPENARIALNKHLRFAPWAGRCAKWAARYKELARQKKWVCESQDIYYYTSWRRLTSHAMIIGKTATGKYWACDQRVWLDYGHTDAQACLRSFANKLAKLDATEYWTDLDMQRARANQEIEEIKRLWDGHLRYKQRKRRI